MKTNHQKATELVQKMTLTEKVGQLAQRPFGFEAYTRTADGDIALTEQFKQYVLKFGGLGMLNNYFRADPWSKRCYKTGGITAAEREKAYNLLQKFVIENTRLGIPVLIEEDAPHGRQVLDSVIYPVSLNVGCSFNPDLYALQAEQIGTEAKLGGVSVPYLSVFDMAADPRWGRFEECFSEDPYLAAQMSESAVNGMHRAGSMVCCKHYLAQGSAVGAHNGGISNLGEREIREIHLPSVAAAVKAECEFIMATYSEIDGEPCHASKYWLQTVLRDELGYNGVVRSDGCAVDRLKDFAGGDLVKAGAIAVRSGVDCGMWDDAMTYLEQAVALGYVTEAEIDQAVTRLIEKKYQCGIMDKPYLDENGQSVAYLNSGTGQQIAYQMACESLVLLKNNGALPLKRQSVLFIGGNCANIYYMLGDYTPEQKSPKTIKDLFVQNGANYLQGWTFEEGITATDEQLAQAVGQADVIIFGCGGSSVRDFESDYNDAGAIIQAKGKYMDCGEGCDLAELRIADCQLQLLRKLHTFRKPIISLVIAGRPYVLTELEQLSDAVVWCGYPGAEGAAAIYDTLTGKRNDFGRLSVSFPKSAGQLPVCYNYKHTAPYVDIDDKPLHAFGYGLSYTTFEMSGFNVESATKTDIESDTNAVKVTFTVRNTGNVVGKAVPQLYVHKCGGTISHRQKELKGFAKIELQPHESKAVTFTLGFDELKDWSVNKRYELPQCRLTVMLGFAADDIVFSTDVEIK